MEKTLLALIADLYAQVGNLAAENANLRAALAQVAAEDQTEGHTA